MKATGIVRRIDDLGRVVIPKEIRRTLRIREGEPMEIFTGEEGEIFLKKHSPIRKLSDHVKELVTSMAQATGNLVCIADQDYIVAASGVGQREYLGEEISKTLEEFIKGRDAKMFEVNKRDSVSLVASGKMTDESMIIQPILSAGDTIGAVILIGTKTNIGEAEAKVAQVAANFLGKQMEG